MLTKAALGLKLLDSHKPLSRGNGSIPSRNLPAVLLLWLMLWGSLNAFPTQMFDDFGHLNGSLLQVIHGIRSLFWVPAGLLAGWTLLAARRSPAGVVTGPVGLMMAYGLVGLLSSVLLSPNLVTAAYWGGAHLSVCIVLIASLASRDCVNNTRRLVLANWLIVAATVFVLSALVRSFFRETGFSMTGDVMPLYGMTWKVRAMAGMPMVLAGGAARYIAVFGIVALSRLLYGNANTLRFLASGFVIVLSVLGLYAYHSRGAIGAFLAAAGVLVLIRAGRQISVTAPLGVVLLATLVWTSGIHQSLYRYALRGQDPKVFWSLGGRAGTWEEGLELVQRSPFLGLGFHADRLALVRQRARGSHYDMGQHMHNAWLHALIQTGIIGASFFVGAFLSAWVLLWRLLREKERLPDRHKRVLLDTAGVLTFLTVRSISESTGAFFGVDWLLLGPLFAYLQILGQRRRVPVAQVPLAYRPHYVARPFYAPAAFHRD